MTTSFIKSHAYSTYKNVGSFSKDSSPFKDEDYKLWRQFAKEAHEQWLYEPSEYEKQLSSDLKDYENRHNQYIIELNKHNNDCKNSGCGQYGIDRWLENNPTPKMKSKEIL